MPTKLPSRLYKYRPLNQWTISTIVNSVIRFSKADDFNDPFDCKLRYNYEGTDTEWALALARLGQHKFPDEPAEAVARSVADMMQDGLHRDMRALDLIWDDIRSQQLAKNGILCLTACPKNILMWSHYADEHKGCCLEFSTDSIPFKRARKVNCLPEYPNARLVDFIGGFSEKDYDKHAKLTTYTKSGLWKYEEEWRVRRYPKGPGLVKFKERLLTGIVFGYRMADELKDMLRKLVLGRNPKVNLFQASLKGRQFEMELLPLT